MCLSFILPLLACCPQVLGDVSVFILSLLACCPQVLGDVSVFILSLLACCPQVLGDVSVFILSLLACCPQVLGDVSLFILPLLVCSSQEICYVSVFILPLLACSPQVLEMSLSLYTTTAGLLSSGTGRYLCLYTTVAGMLSLGNLCCLRSPQVLGDVSVFILPLLACCPQVLGDVSVETEFCCLFMSVGRCSCLHIPDGLVSSRSLRCLFLHTLVKIPERCSYVPLLDWSRHSLGDVSVRLYIHVKTDLCCLVTNPGRCSCLYSPAGMVSSCTWRCLCVFLYSGKGRVL